MAISRQSVAELSPAERRRFLQLLTESATVPNRADYRRRALFLTVTGGGALLMVGWIVMLGFTLPTTSTTNQWKLAWVGFDIGEMLALLVTGYAAWRARRLVIPASLVTGTLLLCDAWFDVILSWGASGALYSIATAMFVEVPLAALFWRTATSLGTRLLSIERSALGLPGPLPHLGQLALFTPLGVHEATFADRWESPPAQSPGRHRTPELEIAS